MLHKLTHIALENKSKNALHCDGVFYTYKELYDCAFGVKHLIQEGGIERVGVYTDNNFYTYAAILGVLLANKTFIPLNHKFPKDRLLKIKESLNLNEVLACAGSLLELKEIGFRPMNIEEVKSQENWELKDLDLTNVSYVLFTSGSTGEPKGIPISYKNLNALLQNVFSSLPLKKEDKVLQTFELSFDVSIACTFMTWIKGATLYVSPLDGIIAVNAFKSILDNEINWVCIAPSAINYLKKLKLLRDYPLPFVTTTIFTGEALTDSFAKDWKECAINSSLYNAYGPTENTVWSFVHELNNGTVTYNGLVPIGKPINGFDYSIAEEEDGVGELRVTGDQVFDGYINNEIKSNEVLIKIREKVFYKTGDLVKEQESGDIMYLNRSDNQVQINGFRVELGEVEFKIKSFLTIENCIAFVQDSSKQLVVVIESDSKMDNSKKKELLKFLPFYMQPKKVLLQRRIPVKQ